MDNVTVPLNTEDDIEPKRSRILSSRINEDRSLLGRLLKCLLNRKLPQKVIVNEQNKKVRIKDQTELYNKFCIEFTP
jgi:hypothetical protein